MTSHAASRQGLWQSRSVFVGLLLAVIGLGTLSVALIETPSRVAVPFLGSLAIIGVALVASRHLDPEDATFMAGVMLTGLGARFLIMSLIHQSVGPYVFAPDAATYEAYGAGLLDYWAGRGPAPVRLEGSIQIGYYMLNAALFAVFGEATVAPAVVNAFLGVLVAVPVYHLTLTIIPGRRGVARWAVLLTVFFPSLLLWSILNIREAPAIFAIVCAALFLTKLTRSPKPRYMMALVLALFALAVLREYMTSLTVLSGTAGIVMSLSRKPARAFLMGAAVLMVIVVSLRVVGLGSSLTLEPDLERVSTLREAMTQRAGSAFEDEIDTNTLGGAIQFLPTGLTRFFLAPYPWTIARGSLLQGSTLPEVLIWYALLPFLIRGVYLGFKHDPSSFVVVASMLLVISSAYALVEGNLGTAYRHRAQVMPLVFVFVALGLRDAWAVRAIRRQQATETRRAMRLGSLSGSRGQRD